MTYRQAITSIQNWWFLSNEELVVCLTTKDKLWSDPLWWTCWGIAELIGPENVKPLLDRIMLTEFPWVADMARGSGCPFGDARVNAMLIASGDPDLVKIANATLRMVSICDQFGVDNEPVMILAELDSMRLERLIAGKLSEGAARWNAYERAMRLWDGDPATEPTL